MNLLWQLFIFGCVFYTLIHVIHHVGNWLIDTYFTRPYKVGCWYETTIIDDDPFYPTRIRRKIVAIKDGWIQYHYDVSDDPEDYCTQKGTRYRIKNTRWIEDPERGVENAT